MSVPDNVLNDQLVSMRFLTQYLGVSDKFIYKLISQSRFPKQLKIGSASRWLKSEVEAYMQERIAASRSKNND